jgi:hypothetical protein
MTYDPITDLRILRPSDPGIFSKLQYRRLGKYKETDWVDVPVIDEENLNDRKDNTLTPNIQRGIREEDPSVS